MYFQTLSVPVVLSLETELGPSLVVISVSHLFNLQENGARLTDSRHNWRCRNHYPRQLHEHCWWNRYPNARCLYR
jgi:hypothetical protein